MSPFSGPNGIWWKILTALLPVLGAAIIAFTRVESNVNHLEQELSKKADAGVVQANQDAILRELNQIEVKLDRLSR